MEHFDVGLSGDRESSSHRETDLSHRKPIFAASQVPLNKETKAEKTQRLDASKKNI